MWFCIAACTNDVPVAGERPGFSVGLSLRYTDWRIFCFWAVMVENDPVNRNQPGSFSRRKMLIGSLAILPALAEASTGKEPPDEVIKLIYVLRRKPTLSIDEFHAHWLNKHAALVRKFAKQTKILRYTQSHTLLGDALREAMGGASDGRAEREITEAEYDGVAELWWRTADLGVFATPIGQKAVKLWLEDEFNFIDIKRSNLWISREHVIVGRVL